MQVDAVLGSTDVKAQPGAAPEAMHTVIKAEVVEAAGQHAAGHSWQME